METVIYRGTKDGTESDGYVVLPPPGEEGESYRFPFDQPIENVPADVVEQLLADDAHHFDVGDVDTSPGEPYPGYDDLAAKEIVERVEATTDAELAAKVAAYEADHENRKTVVEAAKAKSDPEVSQGP